MHRHARGAAARAGLGADDRLADGEAGPRISKIKIMTRRTQVGPVELAQLRYFAAAVAATSLMTACGGGGSGNADTTARA